MLSIEICLNAMDGFSRIYSKKYVCLLLNKPCQVSRFFNVNFLAPAGLTPQLEEKLLIPIANLKMINLEILLYKCKYNL